MRTLLFVFAMAAMLMSTGCSDLLSMHPLATPETAVFDAGLIGEWSCAGSGGGGFLDDKHLKGVALIRADSAQKKGYDIVWLPKEGEALRLKGQLVKVGDRLVFDLLAIKQTDPTGLTVPAHFFMLVEKTANEVKFHWLDSDWLRSQVASKDGLAHVMNPYEDDKPLITAGSADIHAFLAKFGLNPEAVSGSLSFKRMMGQYSVAANSVPTARSGTLAARGQTPMAEQAGNAVGPLLFVTNVGTEHDQVAIIDTGNNTVVGYAPTIGSFTHGVTVTPDGSQAWAAAVPGQQVVVIDCKTLSVTANIPVTGNPRYVAFLPDGSKAYVVTEAGTVAIVNTADYSVITTLDISSGMPQYTQSPPYYMAAVFSLDGGTAYLLGVRGTVTVLDTQTNQVAARLTPGVPGSDTFQWIALSPDGTRYFITDSRLQKLLILDARTNQVITTVDVGGVPRGVVISPDGSTAYIANESGHVQYVDLQTYTITRTIAVGGGGARGIVVTADGSTIYATEARGVAVISTVSNTVVQTIPVNGCCAVQLGLQLPPPRRRGGTSG